MSKSTVIMRAIPRDPPLEGDVITYALSKSSGQVDIRFDSPISLPVDSQGKKGIRDSYDRLKREAFCLKNHEHRKAVYSLGCLLSTGHWARAIGRLLISISDVAGERGDF